MQANDSGENKTMDLPRDFYWAWVENMSFMIDWASKETDSVMMWKGLKGGSSVALRTRIRKGINVWEVCRRGVEGKWG